MVGEEKMREQNINKIVEVLKGMFTEEMEITTPVVIKNNGVELQSVNIRKPDSNISPTIYIDNMLEDIENGEQTVEDVVEVAKKVKLDTIYFMKGK